MNNIINQIAYLKTSREFSSDMEVLNAQLSKSYIDIAYAVNSRIIGIFTTNVPSITGESWFLFKNQRQQSLRQIYNFTTSANIPHNIDVNDITQFSKCSGEYTDGTNYYGVIFGTNVAIAGQLSFYVTPTDIVFVVGGGSPAITSGTIILEWVSVV